MHTLFQLFQQPHKRLWAAFCFLFVGLTACSTTPPTGIQAVSPFALDRYLGQWYEIARLDHSFEGGLTNVSAQYRLKTDGDVEVINRGFDNKKQIWKSATGKARFTGDANRDSLKVSFFGPFYGGYHVMALDQTDYRWAMVVGPNRDYLWILCRDKHLPSGVREQLVELAQQSGIDTSQLIWVEHNAS